MKSKEKLEALNYIWFYEPSCQEEADKREAIIKELERDLKILDILKEHFANDIVSDAARYRFIGKIDFKDEELIGDWLNDR